MQWAPLERASFWLSARLLIGVAFRLVTSHVLQVLFWGVFYSTEGAFGDLEVLRLLQHRDLHHRWLRRPRAPRAPAPRGRRRRAHWHPDVRFVDGLLLRRRQPDESPHRRSSLNQRFQPARTARARRHAAWSRAGWHSCRGQGWHNARAAWSIGHDQTNWRRDGRRRLPRAERGDSRGGEGGGPTRLGDRRASSVASRACWTRRSTACSITTNWAACCTAAARFSARATAAASRPRSGTARRNGLPVGAARRDQARLRGARAVTPWSPSAATAR